LFAPQIRFGLMHWSGLIWLDMGCVDRRWDNKMEDEHQRGEGGGDGETRLVCTVLLIHSGSTVDSTRTFNPSFHHLGPKTSFPSCSLISFSIPFHSIPRCRPPTPIFAFVCVCVCCPVLLSYCLVHSSYQFIDLFFSISIISSFSIVNSFL